MKKVLVLMFVALLTLTACGNVDNIQQSEDEKAKAKTGAEATSASAEETKEDVEKAKEEDIWTYYEDAKWSEDFKGLKSEIQKVVVSNEAPAIDENGEEVIKSAVGVKFKMENTTEGKFTTYPDQATLVTSTGEQVEADLIFSDNLGGEIDKGVIKEGNIIWYLARGEADKIEWIKMSWNTREGAEDDFEGESKDYEIELKLK